jgi:hypothetical protein
LRIRSSAFRRFLSAGGGGTVWWGEASGDPAREDARPAQLHKKYYSPADRLKAELRTLFPGAHPASRIPHPASPN